ncbi:MAG: hypothetical protein WBD27_12345 [Pyrinomonadaceae bacterium]
MKVDMSPDAVTARLRTMDDLWLLSVKLMNSKKVKSADLENEGEISVEERDVSEPPAVAGG